MVRQVIIALICTLITANAVNADEMQGPTVPVIKRHVAMESAWNTNAYSIETANGVILIDSQMLPSDVMTMAQYVRGLGKPVLGLIITHPHYDHFAGIPTLQAVLGDFPVYATAETTVAIPPFHASFLGNYPDGTFADEPLYQEIVAPDTIVQDGQELTFDGFTLVVDQRGPAEADDNIVLYAPSINALFAGDVFYPNAQFYVGEGRSGAILETLHHLKSTYAGVDMVYSGHSNPSRIASVNEQIAFVIYVRALVMDALANSENRDEDGQLTPAAFNALAQTVASDYAHYDDFGIDPVMLSSWNVYGVMVELLSEE